MSHPNSYARRTLIVLTSYSLLVAAIFIKLFFLQVASSPRYTTLAQTQHDVDIPLLPLRGNIYDRYLNILSTSKEVYSAYAVPRSLTASEKEALVPRLVACLGLSSDYVTERLARDKAFVWLKRKLERDEAEAFRALKSESLGLRPEWKRVYPGRTLAAHLLGAVDIDNRGLEGLELLYDQYLSGTSGLRKTQRDAWGRSLRARDELFIPPRDGHHLVLTLDQVIQDMADRYLARAIKESNALGGSVVVMDPRDGSLLAVANQPTFDPNHAGQYQIDARRNRAVTDTFEPGSVFKIVTASAALEHSLFSLDEKIFCENGAYRKAGHTLHDYRPHAWLPFPEVFIKSSNIGTSKIAQRIGQDRLWQAIERFGFGQLTGVDLPGEVGGVARPPSSWSGTSILAIPMGQEVTATALQMVSAMTAVANGGVMMRPRSLMKVIDSQGRTVHENPPAERSQVMSRESAGVLAEILARVVDEGTGRRARLSRFRAAGKTGTAQKALKNRRGYSDTNFVASFVGFAPVSSPQLAICVILDEPKPRYFGGTVCAPVFKQIAEESLAYLSQQGRQSIRVVSSF